MNNLCWLTILVVVESLQLLIAAVYFNTFVPPTSVLQGVVYPEWASTLLPEREMQLYRLFIISAVIFEFAAVSMYKSKLQDESWGRGLRQFLMVEVLVLAALSYVIFKILVYHHPYLTQFFWPLLLLMSVAVKVFWRPLKRMAQTMRGFLFSVHNAPALKTLMDAAVPLFIFLAIYMPRQEALLAQMYFVEQFHHFNTLIMVPAFAAGKGCLLNVDVNSQYGVGMPMVMAALAKWMGGVSYAHILGLLVLGCVLYYWLVYAFLRTWLGNSILCACAVIIGIKWQLFDSGMTPNPFIVPNGLPVRFLGDILFMMLIWRYIQKRESWVLGAAAALAGAAVVWVSDTGTYLFLAFYLYWIYLLAENHLVQGTKIGENLSSMLRYLFIPPVVMLGLYWLCVGSVVLQPVFWNNIKEFFQFFQDGYESVPFYYALGDHRFLDNLVAVIIPSVYMVSLLTVGTLIFLKKIKKENAMVVVLCLYGLCSYHYFLNRSTATSYYVQGLPFVYVLGFWIKQALGLTTLRRAQNILLGFLVFCILALMTTHEFLVYPGMLNFHRNPVTDPLARPTLPDQKYYFNSLFTRIPEELKLPVNDLGQTDEAWKTEDDFASDEELVDYYHQDFDFAKDAALIDSLIPPEGKAAVMSSFDIKMLMQADRKPFFYCFPLLVERPMHMRNFPSTHLHTVARLKRTLQQIEDEKPEYIFMERLFLIDKVSPAFYWWSSDVIALINYVRANYELYEQGYYLVAMKRKKNV